MKFSFTSTSFLLHELVDEDGDSDGVDSLGGDEKVVVIVHDDSKQHERRHASDDGEESLHLWRLSPDPYGYGLDRPLCWPHRVFFLFSMRWSTAELRWRERWLRKGTVLIRNWGKIVCLPRSRSLVDLSWLRLCLGIWKKFSFSRGRIFVWMFCQSFINFFSG